MNVPAPAKPFFSYAVEQDKPETIVVKGHTSYRAAGRAARASYLALRKASTSSLPLLNYGYGEVSEVSREFGLWVDVRGLGVPS